MDDVVAAGDDRYVAIEGPDQVFDHVRFGTEPTVGRDDTRDGVVYHSTR